MQSKFREQLMVVVVVVVVSRPLAFSKGLHLCEVSRSPA